MDKVGAASPQIGDRVWERSLVEAEDAVGMWRRGEVDLDAVVDVPSEQPSSPAQP